MSLPSPAVKRTLIPQSTNKELLLLLYSCPRCLLIGCEKTAHKQETINKILDKHYPDVLTSWKTRTGKGVTELRRLERPGSKMHTGEILKPLVGTTALCRGAFCVVVRGTPLREAGRRGDGRLLNNCDICCNSTAFPNEKDFKEASKQSSHFALTLVILCHCFGASGRQ